MTLLNELYRSGQTDLILNIPFIKKPLFSIHLEAESVNGPLSEIVFNIRFKEYYNQVSKYNYYEIPDFGTLQSILLQSGIVEYPNFTEFLALLHNLCQRDFLRGDRPVFMGLDTNLFRDLFYSAHFYKLANIPQNKIGFSLSPNVKDELTFDKRKYKNSDLKKLARCCITSEFVNIVEDFFNQPCLNDRLCRLGFVEIEKVKRIHWIELLPELDEREIESSGDLNIIKNYKLAAEERNVDILLLSRDDGFIGHAQGIPGIITFQIEKPSFKPTKFKVSFWRDICRLFYLTSVICGAVQIQTEKEKFLYKGIWKGKNTSDWNKEKMQCISLKKSSLVFKECLRSWSIIDEAG